MLTNARPLLAMQRRMQVSARATVTPDNLSLRDTLDEFLALGFHSVGFSPMLSSPTEAGEMGSGDLDAMLEQAEIVHNFSGRRTVHLTTRRREPQTNLRKLSRGLGVLNRAKRYRLAIQKVVAATLERTGGVIAERAGERFNAIVRVARAPVGLNVRYVNAPLYCLRCQARAGQDLGGQRDQTAVAAHACPHFKKGCDRANVTVGIAKADFEGR